jgi:Xaa-Pro aminopeptidase
MIAHGVGLIDEGPVIRHAADLRDTGRDDGVLAPGMVMSVEALVALDDGTESVKLEEMVAITARGPLRLSRYPFEPALLA